MGYPLSILKRLMTHREFLGWCRFYSVEPFDDQRCFDRPAAAVQATMANIKRGPDTAAFQVADFLPYPHDRSDDVEQDIDALVMSKL